MNVFIDSNVNNNLSYLTVHVASSRQTLKACQVVKVFTLNYEWTASPLLCSEVCDVSHVWPRCVLMCFQLLVGNGEVWTAGPSLHPVNHHMFNSVWFVNYPEVSPSFPRWAFKSQKSQTSSWEKLGQGKLPRISLLCQDFYFKLNIQMSFYLYFIFSFWHHNVFHITGRCGSGGVCIKV